MAIDILNEIKAAEDQAIETCRVAAQAAKDALKLAEQENNEIKDKELTDARRKALDTVDAAEAAAKAELDTKQEERLKECDALKQKAEQNLAKAADVCLERILK